MAHRALGSNKNVVTGLEIFLLSEAWLRQVIGVDGEGTAFYVSFEMMPAVGVVLREATEGEVKKFHEVVDVVVASLAKIRGCAADT